MFAADLRIMTVGDSITAGFGYQPRLKTLLEASGYTVTFVGREGKGANRNEGYSGRGINVFVDTVPLPNGSKHQITIALDTAWPSAPAGAIPMVLVHHGINDLGHGLGSKSAPLGSNGHSAAARLLEQAPNGSWLDPLGPINGMPRSRWLQLRLNIFVDEVLAHPSRPYLVVAKILPIGQGNIDYRLNNDNCCERIKEWNDMWAAKVSSLAGPEAARVTIVDCYSDAESKRAYGPVPSVSFWGEASNQAGDWVHPNSAVGGAYTMMAAKFKAGIDFLINGSTPSSPTK